MLNDDVRLAIGDAVADAASLDDAINAVGLLPSTVDKHRDMMLKYGRTASTVVEYGCGFSTFIWLESCDRVVSVDIEKPGWMDRLVDLSGGRLEFIHGSSLDVQARECDVLYVDTLHIYDQLVSELRRHAADCRKFIIMHDTEAFGFPSSALLKNYHSNDKGLIAAVDDFLRESGDWYIVERFSHQFGMTVLGRRP